jgi:hypothetical protein
VTACRVCKTQFTRSRPLQVVCGPECALALSRMKRDRAVAKALADDRKMTRAKLKSLKRRAELVKEAQREVNAYVRLRDASLPCVSCGRFHEGQWHAGHYMSTGARPDLRFDLANIHRQCAPCNNHKSGNIAMYRPELIRRVGLAEVERLEGPSQPDKMTRDELIALKAEFARRVREAQKA